MANQATPSNLARGIAAKRERYLGSNGLTRPLSRIHARDNDSIVDYRAARKAILQPPVPSAKDRTVNGLRQNRDTTRHCWDMVVAIAYMDLLPLGGVRSS